MKTPDQSRIFFYSFYEKSIQINIFEGGRAFYDPMTRIDSITIRGSQKPSKHLMCIKKLISSKAVGTVI